MARLRYFDNFPGSGIPTEWFDISVNSGIAIGLTTDYDGEFFLQQSPDMANIDSSLRFDVVANVREPHIFQVTATWGRFIFIPSSSGSFFRCDIMTGNYSGINAPLNLVLQQDADAIVTRTDSEKSVLTGLVQGQFIFSKQGRNTDVDAAEDIWDGGGDYTGFPTATAEEFQVLSSSAADTSAGTGAQMLRVYYLDDDYVGVDTLGAFMFFDVALNGTTPVNTGITGMRVLFTRVILSGSGQINAGTITVRWRTTTAVVFSVMPAGFGESLISTMTVPAGYTGYLIRYDVSFSGTVNNSADVAIKTRQFESNTFRIIRPRTVTVDNPIELTLYGGITFSEKDDLVFRALSVAQTNAILTASFGMLLVKNPIPLLS